MAIDRVPVPSPDRFEVEEVGPPLAAPWSLAFLPDGSFLVSEKHGGLRRIGLDGSATPPFEGGPPNVLRRSDSGLLDVVLDPDFAVNRTIYLAFAEGTEKANRTALWKAQLEGDRIVNGHVIFRVGEAKAGPSHPGGRILFLPDKTLLLTIGDGFALRDKAQDPASHIGKVLRLDREGKAPADNPFIGRPGYAPEIWALGTRNIQGLTRDPVTGTIWAHEHGPRGGDEINELVAGRNYGWPAVSFGINYDGTVLTDRTYAPGMTGPRFVWSPSIAPSGLAVYRGERYPDFEGKLLVGGLMAHALSQVRIHPRTGLLAEEGRWLTGLKTRIRDVRVAPDGYVYLLTEIVLPDGQTGRLLRLVSSNTGASISTDSPLGAMSHLIGSWSGESRFTPAFQTEQPPRSREENSLIDCTPALKESYIRCTIRFYRKDNGGLRVSEHMINRDPAKAGFDVAVMASNWPGRTSYTLTWDEGERAWVALFPTDVNGHPATERLVHRVSEDKKTVVRTESVRMNNTPNAPWTETFRWTWTRR